MMQDVVSIVTIVTGLYSIIVIESLDLFIILVLLSYHCYCSMSAQQHFSLVVSEWILSAVPETALFEHCVYRPTSYYNDTIIPYIKHIKYFLSKNNYTTFDDLKCLI